MIKTLFAFLFLTVTTTMTFAQSKIDAPTALDLATKGEIVLVDVRRPSEWQDTGVASVAEPISMHEDGFVTKLEQVIKANPGKKVALICAGGVRSAHMQSVLSDMGITDTLDVAEGMMGNSEQPGWIARGLPVRQP
jgi:rhodanese-related sulfurtransferase